MKIRKRYVALGVVAAAVVYVLIPKGPRSGHVFDEAKRAGMTMADFNPLAQIDPAHDYFHDMDRGVNLETKNEINGRNMWLVWTGGDDRFWNDAARLSLGNVDVLKSVSSYNPDKDRTLDERSREQMKKRYKFRRSNRFNYLGAINEPCFKEPDGPDPKRFGLWLDYRDPACPPDPFEDEQKYPGVRIGARGKNIPVGSYYGYGSGILGLRLFPNPDFDDAAAKKWDPVRYYTDPAYYRSKDLILPYRVGMACGFCHAGPDPLHPPADPENPKWENLNSTVGGQHLWIDRIFSWESNPDNFVTQIFRTWRPGTVDVSYISQDYMDNPRTINAIYELGGRLEMAKRFGKEKLTTANRDSYQINHYVPASSPLASFFQPPDTVYTMHVLKDGSDSIGVIASLNRVYLNIGLFSEEWLLHFTPNTGGTQPTPMPVNISRQNSVYWQATEAQTFDEAAFLLRAGRPNRLRDVDPAALPAGLKIASSPALDAGKHAFADRCLRCHSSKLPTPPANADPANCSGNYLDCWNGYWHWTQTDAYRTEARRIAAQPDFLDGNYLSTDLRVPVTLLQTNMCTALASNAIKGNVWDNFSSATYQNLPSVGEMIYYDPITGEQKKFQMPAGGRGYIRPPSLVSLWATAPYLVNNSVGPFDPSPSVEARLKTFQASITQMLWPETRERDAILGAKLPGKIDRTTQPSWLGIPAGYLPGPVRPMLGMFATILPGLFNSTDRRGLLIGPFPSGMPIDLFANAEMYLEEGGFIDRMRWDGRIVGAFRGLITAADEARGKSDEEARRIVLTPEVMRPLVEISQCPDFVVNRGHYFGAEGVDGEAPLSDADRNALIEFLRTF